MKIKPIRWASEVFTVSMREYINKNREDSLECFIGSTERRCMNFIKKNRDFNSDKHLWWWAICREYINYDCCNSNQSAPKETGILYWVDKFGNKSNNLNELIDFKKKKYLKEENNV